MRYTISALTVLLTIAPFASAFAAIRAPFHQNPLLTPAMPDSPSKQSPSSPDEQIFLSDVLSSDRSINIFAGFTRDFAPLSQRFEDGNVNTTILAPLNSAIMSLPRKPWEDREGGGGSDGGDENEKAKDNLRRFVEAHVVPVSPWVKGEDGKTEALQGGKIWWEEKGGIRFIQPGHIEVSAVARTVRNGEVWILKGVRNYA